ncbi:MAG: alpha/beta fold hydrolase [Methylibium sp.]|uniref:alpha/beta hydrolase n=1 Tax=Methylibium sp. TaxID=2067992 RepID=UPI0017DFDA02|nr:alpha/beta hydrolase [Methylibium sp.]MBA3599454.1 alpha/beta fold hydrolase [Methylibium sp.]
MAAPRSICIHLHAYPQLLVDGRSVPLHLKRAWALVACLSDAAPKMSRAQAANLLWPDAETGVGRTRLRRLVHQINTTCEFESVTGDTDAIWLARRAISLAIDLAQTQLAALAVLDAKAGPLDAARLLQPASHTVLAGFALDSETFEAWLATRRREHERLLLRALQRLAEHELLLGRFDAALQAARRLLDIDGCVDAGHALTIEALARLGQGAAVEAAYDQCASLMRHEFGVRPSAAVEAAYAAACAVLQGEPSSPAARPLAATATATAPVLRYANTALGSVAFATLGTGPDTLVLVPEVWSHVEAALDEPRMRGALDRLAQRFRVVMLDRRGAGLSERIGVPNTPEAAVEDVLAVMDCLGAQRAWLLGSSTCGAAGIELAALQPERVLGLILVGVNALGAWAPDYPWAMDAKAMETWIAVLQTSWGKPTGLPAFAPSVAHEAQVQAWWTRTLQHSTTPNGIAPLVRTLHAIDVRHRLADLRVPALVVQRKDDCIVRAGAARYLASSIPGAELLMVEGADHFFWHGDSDTVLSAMEAFVDRHSTESPG